MVISRETADEGGTAKPRIFLLVIPCCQLFVSGILETRSFLSSLSSEPPGPYKKLRKPSSSRVGMEKSRFFGLQPHEFWRGVGEPEDYVTFIKLHVIQR